MNRQLVSVQTNNTAVPASYREDLWTVPFAMTSLFVVFEFTAAAISFPFLQPLRTLLVLSILLATSLGVAFLSGKLETNDLRIKLVLLFWVLMGLHIPFAYNNWVAYGLTKAMAPNVIIFLSIVTFTKSEKQLVVLIHLWLFSHIYQALHGITHGGIGIGGYYGDENDLSLTLVMAIPVAYFLFHGSQRTRRLMYAISLVILILGFVAGFSRGGFMGLIGVAIYCLWRSPKRFTALGTMALLVLAMLAFAPPGYWEEMDTIKMGTENKTGQSRIYLWKSAWRMFLDNPLWGVGPGSFQFAMSIYQPPELLHGVSLSGRALHSSHFQLLAGLALPGLIIYTLIIYKHFQSVLHISRSASTSLGTPRPLLPTEQTDQAVFLSSAAVGFGGGLVGCIVAGAFVSVLYYPQFWTFTGIMVAIHQIWSQSPGIQAKPLQQYSIRDNPALPNR